MTLNRASRQVPPFLIARRIDNDSRRAAVASVLIRGRIVLPPHPPSLLTFDRAARARSISRRSPRASKPRRACSFFRKSSRRSVVGASPAKSIAMSDEGPQKLKPGQKFPTPTPGNGE